MAFEKGRDLATNSEQRPFFQRPMVILGGLLSIPFLLTLAGLIIVATGGPPPGGTTTTCERFITADVGFRITRYTFQSGLTNYDQQTFALTQDGGDTWHAVFEDLVIAPMGTNCDDNILILSEDAFVLWNRNTLAVTQDGGAVWGVRADCDSVPDEIDDCDSEMLDFVAVAFNDPQNGVVEVREFAVNDFGERLFVDGMPIINISFDLLTDDGGNTWEIRQY